MSTPTPDGWLPTTVQALLDRAGAPRRHGPGHHCPEHLLSVYRATRAWIPHRPRAPQGASAPRRPRALQPGTSPRPAWGYRGGRTPGSRRGPAPSTDTHPHPAHPASGGQLLGVYRPREGVDRGRAAGVAGTVDVSGATCGDVWTSRSSAIARSKSSRVLKLE